MKVVIAGGTGFIGGALAGALVHAGHAVVVLTRDPARTLPGIPSGARFVSWDGRRQGPWSAEVDGADGVINLTGEALDRKRWTPGQKDRLRESRIGPTDALVHAIRVASKKPGVFISASAVGYYGPVGEGDVPESHPPGTDFLARLVQEWEECALRAEADGVRVVALRTGIVLARNGGVLARMDRPFRYFVGGSVGSGRQWVPWVHRNDLLSIIIMILGNPSMKGPVNVVSPGPVRMEEFCRVLGEVLRRPTWTRVPSFVLRLVLGEMSTIVLTGQKAVPEVLQRSGYRFQYPSLRGALDDVYT